MRGSRAAFWGVRTGKLFPEIAYQDDLPKGALTVERAVEISAHLWRWKHRQVEKGKREIASLKAKKVAKRQASPPQTDET